MAWTSRARSVVWPVSIRHSFGSDHSMRLGGQLDGQPGLLAQVTQVLPEHPPGHG